MIAMCGFDRLGEAVRNHTSLSALAWIIDSTAMQSTSYLKGQPT